MSLIKGIRNYFDLNSELKKEIQKDKPTGTINFAVKENKKLPITWPQYISLVLGILIQPFFAAYQADGIWDFTGILGRLLFATIAGLIIFPAVYKSSFDPGKSIFPQLCTLFVSGMGWESLLTTAISSVGL